MSTERVAELLGEIRHWPGGYAMSLGVSWGTRPARCCPGHQTPEEAKAHGLVRLGDVASRVADRDIAAWAARDEAAS